MKTKSKLRPPERAISTHRILLVLFALLVVLIVARAFKKKDEHTDEHINVCPVDRESPQWSKRIDAQTCEYFHFSDVERHTHSWAAPCEQSK